MKSKVSVSHNPGYVPRIEDLKAKALKHYLKYEKIAARMNPSCGMNLAAVINPDLYVEARAFNAVMDELAKIDPECPKKRLPVGN